jgi:phosphoribosylanthranilate isomerase
VVVDVTCRVKICGITNATDALHAVAQGADALGFVFYPPSPRYIEPAEAAKIIAVLPPFVSSVGLFVDASEAHVRQVLEDTRLDVIQFHGDEEAAFCQRFNRPYIKALRVDGARQTAADVSALAAKYSGARGILLDTYRQGMPGGTGEVFDWALVPADVNNIVLAGGLTPANVAQAVSKVSPYAVDVSGGVESSHGVKDAAKVTQFIKAAKAASERER